MYQKQGAYASKTGIRFLKQEPRLKTRTMFQNRNHVSENRNHILKQGSGFRKQELYFENKNLVSETGTMFRK